jgi:undecaprenyl-diphosphatase
MKLDGPAVKQAVSDFNIVVQGGAILAVVGLYWPRFVQMLKGLMGRDAAGLNLLVCLATAFVPAAVMGVLLKKVLEEHLFAVGPVTAALVVGGLYMMVLEWWQRGKVRLAPYRSAQLEIEQITIPKAFAIGCLQCIAMWPGTSRSMMTITGGYLVGLKPKAAAEFSFLLGVPTLTGACLYSLYKNLKHAEETQTENLFKALGVMPVVIGVVVAAISAAVAVKFLVATLNRGGLTPWGIYRIVLGVVIFGLAISGIVHIS